MFHKFTNDNKNVFQVKAIQLSNNTLKLPSIGNGSLIPFDPCMEIYMTPTHLM